MIKEDKMKLELTEEEIMMLWTFLNKTLKPQNFFKASQEIAKDKKIELETGELELTPKGWVFICGIYEKISKQIEKHLESKR